MLKYFFCLFKKKVDVFLIVFIYCLVFFNQNSLKDKYFKFYWYLVLSLSVFVR